MALQIPDIATRVTQEIADRYRKLWPHLSKFITTDDDKLDGVFLLPPIGKNKGVAYKFAVMCTPDTESDRRTYNVVKVELLGEDRQPTIVELLYVRNFFFDVTDYIVQFIPSDPQRIANLGKGVVMWRLDPLQLGDKHTFGGLPVPSHIGIGKI